MSTDAYGTPAQNTESVDQRPDEVTQEEATSLSKLTPAILEYLYELPARRARSRGAKSTPP